MEREIGYHDTRDEQGMRKTNHYIPHKPIAETQAYQFAK